MGGLSSWGALGAPRRLNGRFLQGQKRAFEERVAHRRDSLFQFHVTTLTGGAIELPDVLGTATVADVKGRIADAGLESEPMQLTTPKGVILQDAWEIARCPVATGDQLTATRRIIVWADINRDPRLLKYAPRAMVLRAVKRDGMALEHASEQMKNDFSIVEAAVNNTNWSLQFASKRMVQRWVEICASDLQYASEEMKGDRDVVMAAIRRYGGALQYASEDMKNDRELVLEALQNHGSLRHASPTLQCDRDIVMAAVKELLSSTRQRS